MPYLLQLLRIGGLNYYDDGRAHYDFWPFFMKVSSRVRGAGRSPKDEQVRERGTDPYTSPHLPRKATFVGAPPQGNKLKAKNRKSKHKINQTVVVLKILI